jgi:hypothetical protein
MLKHLFGRLYWNSGYLLADAIDSKTMPGMFDRVFWRFYWRRKDELPY